jgi:hypothetical protein
MPIEDDIVYGFNREQAEELVSGLGQRDFRGALHNGVEFGGNELTLYRFTLNASLSGGTADADILLMDGTDTLIDDDVLDPLGIFSTLDVDDVGLCLLQGGAYYVIQAPCPT